jgi:hypothetical protein
MLALLNTDRILTLCVPGLPVDFITIFLGNAPTGSATFPPGPIHIGGPLTYGDKVLGRRAADSTPAEANKIMGKMIRAIARYFLRPKSEDCLMNVKKELNTDLVHSMSEVILNIYPLVITARSIGFELH